MDLSGNFIKTSSWFLRENQGHSPYLFTAFLSRPHYPLFMPRIARTVAPGYPHHVTQRGNNRATVFFDDQDRQTYLDLLAKDSKAFALQIWAYCLMDNHVHRLVVPEKEKSFVLIKTPDRYRLGAIFHYSPYLKKRQPCPKSILQNEWQIYEMLTEYNLYPDGAE